jgi:anaerobic selenocysteine-containing dehydrogenase
MFVRSSIPSLKKFDPDLRVVHYIATRKGDAERGPAIWVNPADARVRLMQDGELVWVHAPHGGQQLAALTTDERVEEHTCVLRDIAGVMLSEAVTLSKPDLDTTKRSAFV